MKWQLFIAIAMQEKSCLFSVRRKLFPAFACLNSFEKHFQRLSTVISLQSIFLQCKNTATSLNPDHILHCQFHESRDVCRERLKSRRSFEPAARKLLDSFSEMDVRAAQWRTRNGTWSTLLTIVTPRFHSQG